MCIVKNSTILSDYEQEVLYHLVELKYSLETAQQSLREAMLDMQRAAYHNNQINDITLKHEMECKDVI
jgi:hypothetical protein